MEANVYFFAALVSTGIFLLQFILSIFFGSMDTDIDVNADGNADIDMSSVLSFKGLIHFCMGFGWFMYLCQPPYIVLHYLGAVISGSFFVFVLAWIYKLCYKLKQENKPEQGEELIGRKCEIYTLIYAAILVAVIVLTIVGILSRYRKCKSDEVLVVYGKTGDKKSAKLYHGGAAFVWPIIQGYSFLNMKPMQIDCKLTGAISKQNIRVDVPTTITVAVSTEPEVMQNAAERLLGLNIEAQQELIKDVVYGQMRLVIADMTIEQLNSDRDTFLENCRKNIDSELKKFGLYLMNINISDIRDEADYIVNLGKEAEAKAKNEALANIEEQQKLGAIKIAEQQKERATKVAETNRDKNTQLADTQRDEEIKVAIADKERESKVAEENAEKESRIAKASASMEVNKEQARTEQESRTAELQSDMEIKQAEAQKKSAIGQNNAAKEVAESNAELEVTKAEASRKAGEAQARTQAAVLTAQENAQREIEEAKARKVEQALKADKIVPAEIAKQQAILDADALAEQIKRKANAEAEAILAKAQAEAKAIQMKLEAEAEGKKKSLLAEAEGFEAMVKAAERNPEIAIQYKMVDQWKEIASEQVKAFEHIQLGNVTVFDGGNGTTSNFLQNVVSKVAPALGILDKLPIHDTYQNIVNPSSKGNAQNKPEKEDFEPVDKDGHGFEDLPDYHGYEQNRANEL